MKRLLLLLSISAPLVAHAAAPNIHVGAMYEYVEPDRASLLKRVRNSGEATAFVRVTVSEVIYDDHHAAREVAVDGLGLGEGGAGLIASPSRLIVPAHGQQATRLVFQGDRTQERYYRVRFIPVLPQSADEFALSAQEREDYREQLSAGVNVLAGYGVFVIVHPDRAHFEVQTEQTDDHVLLHNAGNSTAVLDELRTCTAVPESCTPPQRIHLLPQRSHRLARDAGQQHRLQLVEGERRRPLLLGP